MWYFGSFSLTERVQEEDSILSIIVCIIEVKSLRVMDFGGSKRGSKRSFLVSVPQRTPDWLHNNNATLNFSGFYDYFGLLIFSCPPAPTPLRIWCLSSHWKTNGTNNLPPLRLEPFDGDHGLISQRVLRHWFMTLSPLITSAWPS